MQIHAVQQQGHIKVDDMAGGPSVMETYICRTRGCKKIRPSKEVRVQLKEQAQSENYLNRSPAPPSWHATSGVVDHVETMRKPLFENKQAQISNLQQALIISTSSGSLTC
jgi:hypothetical protein